MPFNISSENYKIVEHGTVIAFDEKSDICFDFKSDENFSMDFNLRIVFKTDDTGKQIINRKVAGNSVEYECLNFYNSGTGTSEAIEIATDNSKRKMYIRFWSYLEGDLAGQKKTRKVEYTFFVGE